MIGVILNLFIGLSLGTNVVIANAIGRKDEHEVQKAVHTSVLAAFLAGILTTLLGEWLIGNFLNLLNVPADVFPYALLYIRIYLLGLPVIFLFNFEAAIFRSTGDTRTPLLALFCGGVLNVLLNLFFCNRPWNECERSCHSHSDRQYCQLLHSFYQTDKNREMGTS